MTLAGWIFLAIIVALVWLGIATYNRLVGLRQRSAEAWSDIDVQLKRRTDLVPNLVETVKGYAAHERSTLEQVVRARGAAVAATTPEARAQAENALTGALRQLFALAESYPELKANVNFQALQHSLTEIEEAVQNARRYYNAVARDLNTAIDSFPSNLIASFFRFARRAYFELDRPEDRQVPRVSFGS
ncbi:MAG TPA: LemA family protein [Methylomirabilota bacterium]|jgi:LemA protein|nr:LemA family protein [Methylomirabilota bacterium]